MSEDVGALVESWQSAVPAAMTELDVPGLAIGICDADGILWSAGYGSRRRGGDQEITPHTVFSVQSTSKLVTALTVLLAVQDGLVDLDAPITRYLPEFHVRSVFQEAPEQVITTRHLLSHTAGFTHDAPIGSNYVPGTGEFADHCRSIAQTWLRFPVGEHFEYSNLGIDLAAYAVERAAARPFAQFAQTRLLDPVGARRASFDPSTVLADQDRAIGHYRPFTQAGRQLPVVAPMLASGGMYASVTDLLQLVVMLLRGGAPLLDPALAAEQYQLPFAPADQRLGYGLGVYVDEWDGVPVRHHGGSGFGFQCQVCWVPEVSLGLVVLTNSFDHDLQNQLAREFVAHLAPTRASRDTTPANPAADVCTGDTGIVGEYVGRLSSFRIAERDGRLCHVTDTARPLRFLDDSTIDVEGADGERFRFGGGPQSRFHYARSLRTGDAWYRNEPADLPPSRMAAEVEGTYHALSWGVPVATFRIMQDGATPAVQETCDMAGAGPHPAVYLTPLECGSFISTTGEVLDVAGEQIRFRNIPLVRIGEP